MTGQPARRILQNGFEKATRNTRSDTKYILVEVAAGVQRSQCGVHYLIRTFSKAIISPKVIGNIQRLYILAALCIAKLVNFVVPSLSKSRILPCTKCFRPLKYIDWPILDYNLPTTLISVINTLKDLELSNNYNLASTPVSGRRLDSMKQRLSTGGSENVLSFWKMEPGRIPILARIAFLSFSPPASSDHL